MSLPSLYTLSEQYRELERMLGADEELDEHAIEAINTTLDCIADDIQVKATNVAAYTLNLQALADAAKDASKKLAERAKRIERRSGALREYIKTHMEATGITKIEGPQFTLAIRKNPAAVEIAPDATIPAEYLRAPPPPPEPAPDKAAIARALKDGAVIDGCSLHYTTRLEVKS